MDIIIIRKAVKIKTCMTFSLMITPDPPLDLPPALSLISTAALLGESTSMKLSCRVRSGHQVYMSSKIG
jgi:hypothetical protein